MNTATELVNMTEEDKQLMLEFIKFKQFQKQYSNTYTDSAKLQAKNCYSIARINLDQYVINLRGITEYLFEDICDNCCIGGQFDENGTSTLEVTESELKEVTFWLEREKFSKL